MKGLKKINRTILTTAVVICISVFSTRESSAQVTKEISLLGGYALGETFTTTDAYEVYMHDGAMWGGSIAFYPDPHYDIALTYTREQGAVDVYDYLYNHYDDNIKASVNYIMIGADRNQVLNSNGTCVFGGLNLGAAGLEPSNNQDDPAYNNLTGRWKFAFDIHAGAKIFPSPKVGIRLQAGINFPVQYFGAAFTVGTGGSGAGVSATSTITQVNFLGGLIFRLPSK